MAAREVHYQKCPKQSGDGYSFWNANEEGLFQRGHSKDHRPDLAQLKLMLATLDPERIISKHRVQSVFQLKFQEQVEQQSQRRYRDRSARMNQQLRRKRTEYETATS